MNRTNKLIGRNEETLESLEALRKALEELLPVMKTIFDGFLSDRDRSQKLEGPLADALTAWCALAIAAKEPFYSEEAANTPEADAGLDEPLERPTDKIEDKPLKKTGTTTKKTTAKPAVQETTKTAKPIGDVLDLGGATVIEPGQFIANMTLRKIVIPEGVTEIGDRAFSSCMLLESVVFPNSLKKIGEFAFMSCRNLSHVELKDGVEEIGTHAFGATNSLKEVRLPDSLKKVDRTLFGMGGDSPYATAYMSGHLACHLMETYNKGKSWPSDAIYARHYVIDGVAYENMSEFWEKIKDGSVKVKPAVKPKEEAKAETKPAAKKPAEKKPAAKPATKPAASKPVPATSTVKATPAAGGNGITRLNITGSVIRKNQFWHFKERVLEIPEGITEIEHGAFSFGDMEEVRFPKSLRKICQQAFQNCSELKTVVFQEGLSEIEGIAFTQCPKLDEVHLPNSIQKISNNPFADDIIEHKAHVIVHLSGDTAERLYHKKEWTTVDTIEAGGFVIDGTRYRKIEDYIPVLERNRRAREEYERQEQARKQAEEQKRQQRERILARISQLEKEREAVTGIFAGMKKKKIQRQIDELKQELRKYM